MELSQNDDYHLRPGDADILVQIKCPDLLWQKERLFNIGLQSVPRGCDTVAWLDCDAVFESDDWPERASNLLENYRIVMPFKYMYELPKDAIARRRRFEKARQIFVHVCGGKWHCIARDLA